MIDHPRDGHDDLANAAMAVAVLAGTFGGYTLELLGSATAWAMSLRQSLVFPSSRPSGSGTSCWQRYGQPVPFAPMPREHVEQAPAVDPLPAPVREAMERARADALRRRNGGET